MVAPVEVGDCGIGGDIRTNYLLLVAFLPTYAKITPPPTPSSYSGRSLSPDTAGSFEGRFVLRY